MRQEELESVLAELAGEVRARTREGAGPWATMRVELDELDGQDREGKATRKEAICLAARLVHVALELRDADSLRQV